MVKDTAVSDPIQAQHIIGMMQGTVPIPVPDTGTTTPVLE